MLLAPFRLGSTAWLLWRSHGVPPHRSVRAFLEMRRRLGITRYDFLTYRLWDESRPLQERLAYMSLPDRLRLEDRINPLPDRRTLMSNKAEMSERLADAGLPTPEVLAVAGLRAPPSTRHRVLKDQGELVELLRELPPGGVVCKPIFGHSGHGVMVFGATSAEGAQRLDGTWMSVEVLWQHLMSRGPDEAYNAALEGWIVQRRVPPHPDLAAIHGDTLGCVRVVTFRRRDGRIGLTTPPWKIPVGRSGVDNIGHGSFTAPVDLDTGAVGAAVLQETMLPQLRHPDTGVSLSGITLPHWSQAKEVVTAAMALYPTLHSLGFDVGIGRDGPTIVEINTYWGPQFMQSPQGRGLVQGEFLEFLEEIGAEDVIRREQRGLPPLRSDPS